MKIPKSSTVRASTQQKLKISERVIAYTADDMNKVARLDERKEDSFKCKPHQHNIRKCHTSMF